MLEVKLSLKEGQKRPEWVSTMLASGYCSQVHKFSKYIHGCAVLMTNVVQCSPYWVDDESIRASILHSAHRASPRDIARY